MYAGEGDRWKRERKRALVVLDEAASAYDKEWAWVDNAIEGRLL